jgi:hypothetical protein
MDPFNTLSGPGGLTGTNAGFNFSSLALPLFAATLAAVGLMLLFFAIFGRPKKSLSITGELRFEPSDIEKFFLPLAQMLIRGRVGGQAQLARELQWTRSRLTPASYLLLPFVFTPTGFIGGLMLAYLVLGFDFQTALLCGLAGAVIGWFYLRSTHSRALRARQDLIRDDAIDLMGTYASVAVSSSDMTTIFAEIDKQVREERERAKLRLAGNGRRRSRPGPYDGEVYLGLSNMMDNANQGLVNESGDMEHPDLIQTYAIYCNDYDMTNFLMQLRQAAIQHRAIKSDQIEQQVRELRLLRIDQIKSTEASQQLKATVFLVLFNLLILFAVILLPLVAPYIPLWFSGQLGV